MKIKVLHRSGFSLLELLVVLLITLVLTLIAVGSYSNFKKARRIKAAAESVNAAFVAARSYAISTNGTYRVVFQFRNPQTDTEEYAFWIDEVERGTTGPDFVPLTAPASIPPTPLRAKVTTPHFLQPGVKLHEIRVNSVQYSVNTAQFALVHFQPEGRSGEASVSLLDEHAATNVPENYYSVKLYGPTAKTRIIPMERKL